MDNHPSKRGQVHWIATDLARAELDDQGRKVTFHSFRRFYITRLIRAGAKIHEVRRMARHRDVKTTLDHYTDENLADLAKLADLMDTGAQAEPPIEPPAHLEVRVNSRGAEDSHPSRL